MILDVGPLLRGETESIAIDYMLTPQKLDGVTFNGDAHVLGTIKDNAGYMRLTLNAELSYSSECARCLAPVDGVFSLDFERTVVSEGTLSDEQLEEHFDEYAILNGTMLDIDEPLAEVSSQAISKEQTVIFIISYKFCLQPKQWHRHQLRYMLFRMCP